MLRTVQSACLLQIIAEHTGLRPLGQFPRGSVPGLWNRCNCDLVPLLHTSICSVPRLLPFKAACHNISGSLLLLCSFTLFSISYPLSFIPPNNFIHHPIRGGKLFVSCPYRDKAERWESEKGK